jgi:hypothetical protein
MNKCGLDDDDSDDEEVDTEQQPYATETVRLPSAPAPQCPAEPVDCRDDFELYHQSTQQSQRPLDAAPHNPMAEDNDRKEAIRPALQRELTATRALRGRSHDDPV